MKAEPRGLLTDWIPSPASPGSPQTNFCTVDSSHPLPLLSAPRGCLSHAISSPSISRLLRGLTAPQGSFLIHRGLQLTRLSPLTLSGPEASNLDHSGQGEMANVPWVPDWVLEANPPVALCGDEIATPPVGDSGLLASSWPPGLLKS